MFKAEVPYCEAHRSRMPERIREGSGFSGGRQMLQFCILSWRLYPHLASLIIRSFIKSGWLLSPRFGAKSWWANIKNHIRENNYHFQNLEGSFSAVSTPIFEITFSFCSVVHALQDVLSMYIRTARSTKNRK